MNPRLLDKPFANIGTKNDIPDTVAAQPQQATMETGFPQITQTPISEGGVPPERADFNGILNIYGQHIVHLNKGLGYQYDSAFAIKIGGYPLGATVVLDDGITEVQSVIAGNLANPNVDVQGWVKKGDAKFYVESIADLPSINNPKDGDAVFVNEINQFYTYNSASAEQENGVTVVGKWVMNVPDFYYASWFAKKDIQEPQDVSLQKGYAYATSKSRPFVIDGHFYLDGRLTNTGLENGNPTALLGLSNSHVIFVKGVGKLQVIPNNYALYSVFTICKNAENIILDNPHFIGDRKTHTYDSTGNTTHEFGYGLTIYESKNIVVNYPIMQEMTGDGIYIGKAWASQLTTLPTNITINHPNVDHVRRNGISICGGSNVYVESPVVGFVGDSDGIIGAFPKSCIDFEPENAENSEAAGLLNIVINNPYVHNSYAGVYVYGTMKNTTARTVEVSIYGELKTKGITNTGLGMYIAPSVTGFVQIDNYNQLSNTFVCLSSCIAYSNNFKVNIDKYQYHSGSAMRFINRNQESNKVIGNININSFVSKLGNNFTVVADGDSESGYLSDFTIDGLVISKDKSQEKGVNVYTDNIANQASLSGSKNNIDSDMEYVWSGLSSATNKMPNTIWHNPTAYPTVDINLNTATDFRLLKIGLRYTTSTIGFGCNIMGLSVLRDDGTIATRARCTTRGGWLKFKNVSGGRTIIYDSFGTWVFS